MAASVRATGTDNIGSSVEQLTRHAHDTLAQPLADFHRAMQTALAGHVSLPLYNWLYETTLPYIVNAAGAIDEAQHIGTYITIVVNAFQNKLSERAYKSINTRKKELFDRLIELYKFIMILNVSAGKKLITAHDNVSSEAIAAINIRMAEIQPRLATQREAIRATQQIIRDELAAMTAEKALELHPKFSEYSNALNLQLTHHTDSFREHLQRFNEFKGSQVDLLQQIQKEVLRIEMLTISEAKVDATDLLANSPIRLRIDHQMGVLQESERVFSALLAPLPQQLPEEVGLHEQKVEVYTLASIRAKASEIRDDLVRQKLVLDTLGDEKHGGGEELKRQIDTLAAKAKEQGWSKPWYSDEKGHVQSTLSALHLALLFVRSLTLGHDDSVAVRQGKLQEQLSTVTARIQEIRQEEAEAALARAATRTLTATFETTKTELARTLPALFAEHQAAEKRLVDAKLRQARAAYVLQLNMLKSRLTREVDAQRHGAAEAGGDRQPLMAEHQGRGDFTLPSPRRFAVSAVASGALTLGASGVALAAFIFKAAALAFIASNPVGWLVGLGIGAVALIGATTVLAKKAYNRYKKNKLLERYEPDAQEDLFKQNEDLKQQSFTSTTRFLMMLHGIKIKADALAVDGNVVCQVVGQEDRRVPLYLNVGTKQVFFKTPEQPIVPVAVEMAAFQEQVRRYSAAAPAA